MNTTKPILELDHVRIQYGERIVLDDLNVRVDSGEFIGVIGANGAGKTTLLRVILGLLPPASGSIRMLGAPLKKRDRNRAVGYVPQKIHLDPDTPLRGRDLVGFGLDGHRLGVPLPSRTRTKRIDAALAAVHALPFANAPVGRLSGGEQQRLLIAQALLTDPQLLLLDEPLSNLDIRSAHEVVDLVVRIGKERGIAVMIVAHDMNPLLGAMDKVLYLAQGRAAMGPVADVIKSDVLSRLYGYDVEVLRIRDRILVVGGSDAASDVVDFCEGCHCDGDEAMAR